MAVTSGSYTTNAIASSRTLTYSWSLSSQSITENASYVYWELRGSGGTTGSWVKGQNFRTWVDGNAYSSSTNISVYNGTLILSGTTKIPHNSDGTRSFGSNTIAQMYNYVDNTTGSGSWELPRIAREAAGYLNVPGGNIITQPWSSYTSAYYAGTVNYLVYFTNNTGSPQANLIFTSGDITGTGTVTQNIHTAIQTFLNNNPNYKVDSNCQYYIYAYRRTNIGGTIFTTHCNTVTLTNANLKEWLRPTFGSNPITSQYLDTPSTYLTTVNTQILKNLSTLRINLGVVATMIYNSTVASYLIYHANKSSSALTNTNIPYSWDSGVDTVVDTSIKLVVTDSRGIAHEYYYSLDAKDYAKPTLNGNFEIYKKVTGNNVYVKASGTIYKNTPVANGFYAAFVRIGSTNYSFMTSITIDANGNWTIPEVNLGSVAGTNLTGYISIADKSRIAVNGNTIDIIVSSPTLSLDTTNKKVGIAKDIPVNGALDVNGDIYQNGRQVLDYDVVDTW